MDSSNVKQEVVIRSTIQGMPTTSIRMASLSDQELIDLAQKAHEMPDDLTVEQRALIHLDARIESRRVLRKYRNSAVAAFLVLAVGMGVSQLADSASGKDARQRIVASGNAVATASCNRDFRTSLRQRQSLYRQPHRAGEPVLTEEQKDKIIRDLTPLPDCRVAQHAITDNPSRDVRMQKPLYEGLVGERGQLKRSG